MVHLRVRWPAVGGAVFAASALFSGCHSAPVPVTDGAAPVTPNFHSVAEVVNRQVKEPTAFTSPSGNVGCHLDASVARCDIRERSWAPPLRPASCQFAYGQGMALRPGRPAEFVCSGDSTLGAGAELGYGDSITAGTLRCESADTGITCRDTKTRHGFTLSREAYHLF